MEEKIKIYCKLIDYKLNFVVVFRSQRINLFFSVKSVIDGEIFREGTLNSRHSDWLFKCCWVESSLRCERKGKYLNCASRNSFFELCEKFSNFKVCFASGTNKFVSNWTIRICKFVVNTLAERLFLRFFIKNFVKRGVLLVPSLNSPPQKPGRK